jgi:hypothetical protein
VIGYATWQDLIGVNYKLPLAVCPSSQLISLRTIVTDRRAWNNARYMSGGFTMEANGKMIWFSEIFTTEVTRRSSS